MVSITRWHCPPTYLLIITGWHTVQTKREIINPNLAQGADTKSPARLIDSIKRVNNNNKKNPQQQNLLSLSVLTLYYQVALKSARLFLCLCEHPISFDVYPCSALPRSDVLLSPEIGIRLAKAQRADGWCSIYYDDGTLRHLYTCLSRKKAYTKKDVCYLNGWLHNTVGCWRPFSNLFFFQ